MIILYGGLFGIGINDLWTRSLTPWQSAIGAAIFMTAFAVMAQFVTPFKNGCQAWWEKRCDAGD